MAASAGPNAALNPVQRGTARKIDDLTVELTTKEPDSFLPLNLTNLFIASPSHWQKKWDALGSVSDNAERAKQLAQGSEYAPVIDQVRDLRQRHADVQKRVIGLLKTDAPAALSVLVKEETVVWREMRTKLIELRKTLAKDAQESRAGLLARGSQVIAIGVTIGLLACVISVAMMIYLSRRIHRDLGGEPHLAAQAIHAIAAGDLGTRVPVQPGDRTSLLASIDTMAGALRKVVGAVHVGVDEVHAASQTMVSDNETLSERTEKAASSRSSSGSEPAGRWRQACTLCVRRQAWYTTLRAFPRLF